MRIIDLKPKYEDVIIVRNNKPIFKGNFIEAQERFSKLFIIDISNFDEKKLVSIRVAINKEELLKCL